VCDAHTYAKKKLKVEAESIMYRLRLDNRGVVEKCISIIVLYYGLISSLSSPFDFQIGHILNPGIFIHKYMKFIQSVRKMFQLFTRPITLSAQIIYANTG
jgi:hypothetical protein